MPLAGTFSYPEHFAQCKKDGTDENCDTCATIREKQMKGSLSIPPEPDPLEEIAAMSEDISNIIKLAREMPITLHKDTLKKKYLQEIELRAAELQLMVEEALKDKK